MDKEYLIIFGREGITHHAFLETEDKLTDMIGFCNRRQFEIIFAAQIAVIKEFIG